MAKINYERIKKQRLSSRGIPVNSLTDPHLKKPHKFTGEELWLWGKKHQNKCLKDLPTDYLIWVLENFDTKIKTARDYAEQELTRRINKIAK